MYKLSFILFIGFYSVVAQPGPHHKQAHSHNDYEHTHPLWDALSNGFVSVEADVHLVNGQLFVSHNKPSINAKTLGQLYLSPLDSLLSLQDNIYTSSSDTFYLMIDCKTEAESTFKAIQNELANYKSLLCNSSRCPVKIFISGNRALTTILKEGNGIGVDGRPADLGKGISSDLMPVVSDNYTKWSSWNGKAKANAQDLSRIRELANKVHAENKKLRLWAAPDNELAWAALLEAGVDFINTDNLVALNKYLSSLGR